VARAAAAAAAAAGSAASAADRRLPIEGDGKGRGRGGWEGKRKRGGRLGATGSFKHSIPTSLSVIKSDLHFGEARDAAMKSYAATKGQAKFKCVGSLGWDISVSYHVLQLLSSLTSRSNAAVPETGRSQLLNLLYQAIILRTTLFSKERFTK
jgi:hypothetical protein